MQIHELNTGVPTSTDVIAMDTGSDTYKTTAENLIPAYTSGDSTTPTAWTSVSALTSGLTISTLFSRISTMVKNVRWLYSVLGTSNISSIGTGTVTNAISTINSNMTANSLTVYTDISSYNSESNKYTIPADGYVFLSNSSGQTGEGILYGNSSANAYTRFGQVQGRWSVYVRKDMKIYLNGTANTFRFIRF